MKKNIWQSIINDIQSLQNNIGNLDKYTFAELNVMEYFKLMDIKKHYTYVYNHYVKDK